MSLQELIDFCDKYAIEAENVTFGFGCKEVYACFTEEDFAKFNKTEDDFNFYAEYEEWCDEQDWSVGEWDCSIRIY